MARNALEDQKFELIKAHVLDPASSSLPPDQQLQLNRVLSMARLMDVQPIQNNAVRIHLKKYKDIKRSQAYEDYRLAVRLFNSTHTFDYDLWMNWMLNDIYENIKRCKGKGDVKALRVVAMEHANLIKILGERPPKEIDPKLLEQHNFILTVVINGKKERYNFMDLLSLPEAARKRFADSMITDVDFEDVDKIINS